MGVMRIFYHVTRDIELPAPGRPSASEGPARTCEACGGPILAPPGSEGSESGTYGLSFCAGCRDRLDRSAIQIHFCDVCGVSVPLYAVQAGTALAGDGRILCVACRAPAPRRRVRLFWPVVAAAAALAAGALAAAFT